VAIELLVDYQPNGPYTIQSGKHAGKALELLMFENHGLLAWMFQKGRGRTDKFSLHLAWLLRQGENLRPKMICPQCHERPVAFFSVAYSQSGNDFMVSTTYTYCEICKKSVDTQTRPISLFSFRFSTLGQFRYNSRRKQISDLFRQVYGLPKPLTRAAAFEFFNSIKGSA